MTAKPDEPHLGLVVEGSGELEALPLLLRSLLQRAGCHADILGKPVPCHGRDKALKPKGIEGKVATAASRPGCRAVLVVLDGEGDAVCELGPVLLKRAREAASGKPVFMCLADPKYEAWFVASAETMELSEFTFQPSRDPVAHVKAALHPVKYVKPTWQPRLTKRIDPELAMSRSSSFRRFAIKIVELCSDVGLL